VPTDFSSENLIFPLGILLSFSRLESQNPLENSKKFADKTNSGSFLGDDAKTWLCTSINGSSDDAGETYQVSYVFERKIKNWDVNLSFTDKETGQIPTDVEDQPDAQKDFQLQETADFSELEIESFII